MIWPEYLSSLTMVHTKVALAGPLTAHRDCSSATAMPSTGRTEAKKTPATTELLVGNDISNIEAVRFQLKTPHDDNIVTHYQAQELLLDYTFSKLGISSSGGVQHPVVMTEAMLNPNYCRGLMSELLFECYNVPQVAYCVDGLASYYYNQGTTSTKTPIALRDGLLLNIGHNSSHVVPVLDGEADVSRARRIKIGGNSMTKFLCRWLQLKYSHHANNITLSRAEELIHQRMSIAQEFQSSLAQWSNSAHYAKHVVKVQLPYTVPVLPVPVDPVLQRERRREAAKRLVLINARKREEKLLEDESELQRLSELCSAMAEFTPYQPEYQHALEEAGAGSMDELARRITVLQQRVTKTRLKLAHEATSAAAAAAADDNEEKESPPTPTASTSRSTGMPSDPLEAAEWLAALQREWSAIQQRRGARRNRRQEMAKRRTVASQERMRIISQLAKREKKDDNFGRRDEDWDVYKAINKEGGGSDSEEESERLAELSGLLKQHSPEFLAAGGGDDEPLTLAEKHQFHLATELIRTGELLFQPSMVGVEQGGLTDTVQYVLSLYPEQQQQRLVNNVLVTGGAANMPGLITRIETELRAMRPFQSHFCVTRAQDPSLDAWRGCRLASSELLREAGLSRAQYQEQGGDRLPRHCLGNTYWASRVPEPAEDVKPAASDLQPNTSDSMDTSTNDPAAANNSSGTVTNTSTCDDSSKDDGSSASTLKQSPTL